jgi:Hypothetical protein (DUF2513)
MMPRDMDLIRKLLLRFERDDTSIPDGYTNYEVAYHVNQMVKSGLIDAEISQERLPGRPGTLVPSGFRVRDIEPAGHDFIAGLKDDGFWAKLKREALARVAPLTLDLLILIAKETTKNAFGLGHHEIHQFKKHP